MLLGRRLNGLGGVCPVVLTELAADRLTEIAQPGTELLANLGQALGPEDEQRDHQDEEQVCGFQDVAEHSLCSVTLRADRPGRW